MSNDNVFDLKKPEPFIDDPITMILHKGIRKLLDKALKDELGRQRIVRNGQHRKGEIQSGIGSVLVKALHARDRQVGELTRIQFQSMEAFVNR